MGGPRSRKLPIFAALAQGFFCAVIGLWPVISFQSFQSVTGQKPDHWLLTLAGLLLAGIGCSMLISALRRDVAFEVFALGLITALSLAATDVIFFIERIIPAVYLLDAVAESLFVTLWVFAIRSTTRGARRPPADPVLADPPPIVVKTTEPRGMDEPK
jgi:drug/metabolite transporter (DMT)-like permease